MAIIVTDARARRLRSAVTRTLAVGRTQSTFGDRTFTAAAPRLWNSLPPDLRQPGLSYGQFRRSLKTFLARDSIYAIARYMPSPVRPSVRLSVCLSVRHTGGSVKDG